MGTSFLEDMAISSFEMIIQFDFAISLIEILSHFYKNVRMRISLQSFETEKKLKITQMPLNIRKVK